MGSESFCGVRPITIDIMTKLWYASFRKIGNAVLREFVLSFFGDGEKRMERRKQELSTFSILLDTIVDHKVSFTTIDKISNSLIGKTAEEDALVVEYTRKIKAGLIK